MLHIWTWLSWSKLLNALSKTLTLPSTQLREEIVNQCPESTFHRCKHLHHVFLNLFEYVMILLSECSLKTFCGDVNWFFKIGWAASIMLSLIIRFPIIVSLSFSFNEKGDVFIHILFGSFLLLFDCVFSTDLSWKFLHFFFSPEMSLLHIFINLWVSVSELMLLSLKSSLRLPFPSPPHPATPIKKDARHIWVKKINRLRLLVGATQ